MNNIQDYTGILFSTLCLAAYVIFLNRGNAEKVKQYVNTFYGKILVILLIFLTLQRSVQIGLIIFLAYMMTVISTTEEGFKNSNKSNKSKKSKKTKKNKEHFLQTDTINDVDVSLGDLSKAIDEVFGPNSKDTFQGNTDTKNVLENLQSTLDETSIDNSVVEEQLTEEQLAEEETNEQDDEEYFKDHIQTEEPFTNYSGDLSGFAMESFSNTFSML